MFKESETLLHNQHFSDIFVNLFEDEPALLKKMVEPIATESKL